MNKKIRNIMTIIGMLLLFTAFVTAANTEQQEPAPAEPDNTCSAVDLFFIEPYRGCNFYCPWCPVSGYSCDSGGSCC